MRIITVFLLLMMHGSFAQDCNTKAASKPVTSSKAPDNFVNDIKGTAGSVARMKPHLGQAESWVKNVLTGFTGAKLLSSNDFYFDRLYEDGHAGNFYKSTGIKGSFSFKMRFFAYYCYDNKEPIHTEGESGSFIRVTFNNLFLPALCSEAGTFAVDGKPVFKILEKSRTTGRLDLYDFRAKSTVNDTVYTSKHEIVLIRNSDKPVFITITRKEWLQQMLKDIETYRVKQKEMLAHIYESQVKQFEAEVKIYKIHDKNYTAEKEASQRKKFTQTTNPQKLEQDIKKLDTEVNGAADMIRQYQKKPHEWLGRSVRNFYFASYTVAGIQQYLDGLDNFRESKADLTRTELAYINPAYFNNGLSVDVPQLIIVDLQKMAYPHMLKVSAMLKRDGIFRPLEAILRGDKQAAPVAATEVKSNYQLKYLPKLAMLTALVVPVAMKPSASPVDVIQIEILLPQKSISSSPHFRLSSTSCRNF